MFSDRNIPRMQARYVSQINNSRGITYRESLPSRVSPGLRFGVLSLIIHWGRPSSQWKLKRALLANSSWQRDHGTREDNWAVSHMSLGPDPLHTCLQFERVCVCVCVCVCFFTGVLTCSNTDTGLSFGRGGHRPSAGRQRSGTMGGFLKMK